MMYDRSLHGSLREEVQVLRKRVVALETAEADNEKLRKELAKLKVSSDKEKSQLELDFINQLTGVARENSLKLEELEGRLTESSKVNRALSEKLQEAPSPEMVRKRSKATEDIHKKEMEHIIDSSKAELERTRQQLANLLASRDELTEQLEDANMNLDAKGRQLDSLKAKSTVGSDSIQKLLRESHEESAKLKSKMRQLEDSIDKTATTFESETRILKDRLNSRNAELNAKTTEVRRLESQASSNSEKPTINTEQLNSLQKKNGELNSTLQKLEIHSKQQGLSNIRLERASKDLTKRCDLLEKENQDLTHSLCTSDRETNASISRRSWSPAPNHAMESEAIPSQGTTTRNPLVSPQFNSRERKTTQIIRRLESNLKKEVQTIQIQTAGLKYRRRPEAEPETPSAVRPVEIGEARFDLMRDEIDKLKNKLDMERDLSTNLRCEISEMKLTQSQSNVSKIPAFAGKMPPPSLNRMGSPARDSSKRRSLESKEPKAPRTPVRGLVQSFEQKISQNTNRQMADIASFDNENIEDLKEALHYERQQIFELEDELTRQCEINCSLLKEITSLTSETEVSRSRNLSAFQSGGADEQTRQVQKLSTEVTKLKNELAETEQSKAYLSSQFEKIADSDRNEIERLTTEFQDVKSKLAKAQKNQSSLSTMEQASSSDRKEIDRLRTEVRQLGIKLSEAEIELVRLYDEKSADKMALDRREKAIQSLEKQQLSNRQQSQEHGFRASELEAELAKLRTMQSEYSAQQDEVAGLNSLVEALQSNLTSADETKESLQKEKEAGGRLDRLVQSLKTDLNDAEEKFQNLSDELVNTKGTEATKIRSLMMEVDTLHDELKRVTEQRDEIQENERAHVNKFDTLRGEIDGKVDEFEKIHSTDKEQISRLHTQVKSLENELHETLETVEKLQKQLQEKEEVEDTIEELQRQNQQSLNSQINKLQKELIQTHLSEAQGKKKIESLEDELELLQGKNEALIGEKDKAVQTIKTTLMDKESVIGRLTNEKEHLVLSMKDMTSSRRDELDELQTELMEMSTRAANQAREVQTLKVQLEDSSYRKDEVERLRSRVRELSEQWANHSSSRGDGERTTELQLENSELRQRLRDTSLALKGADGKMRELMTDKGGSSKSMQVVRERNASLKFEVEKLTKKLRKLAERKQQQTIAGTRERPSQSERYSYNDKSHDAVEATRFMI